MATQIIHFGVDPSGGILAALAANGYEVAVCGTSIPKLPDFASYQLNCPQQGG